ncbi:Endonuclease/exonuclease/phosphatase [Suillus discolor]|uniref:Endonuclease/exonuclease/phosphatase n=1 Tax=Suillus discolor TaxID=1912936 RepID=A0A9P7FF93_9AGAM|nr:Endonuclease/exonuclease/phosphatase [Suillus discolor]KAG2116710.1 Endonuclease/exonuclease/phosphatase [Suillus discolor]
MRGRWHNGIDKWNHINQVIRDKKIGIMAIQETHLSKEEESKLNETFGCWLKIVSSIDPENTNAKGIAIVLNVQMTRSKEVTSLEIVPGRALMIHIPWTKNTILTILAIYALNEPSKNQLFWDELRTKLEGKPKPDVMLGDFNIVEDALDRLPCKQDNEYATESLVNLKLSLDLRDRWRAENPNSLAFTFAQSHRQGGRQSRIDRIYISEDFMPFSKEWRIEPSGIATDHQLISARISDIRMPFVGKGRWTLPLFILKDKRVQNEIVKMGRALQKDIISSQSNRSEFNNPQIIFKMFKDKVIHLCRDTARKSIPIIQNRINTLKTQLKTCLNDHNLPEDKQQFVGIELQEKISNLERKHHENIRDNLAVKMRIKCESPVSKLWSRSGKDIKPRDTIVELKTIDSPAEAPIYESRSDKMAQIARNHHNNLQNEDLAPEEDVPPRKQL